MCGIFGVINLKSANAVPHDRFAAALEAMAHRGPDGRQVQRLSNGSMFGHARLSTIDLSTDSDQPFRLGDRYWMTYNGEVFNYVELREELKALGAVFSTVGDTEVVLQAYKAWGEDCVNRFNGMWAFAIYDEVDKTLFASRDRFGIKPFNYAVTDGRLLFASEIKSILHFQPELAQPDDTAIANFCRTSVGAQHEQTWFRDILRLQPGFNLGVDAEGEIKVWRYWDYPAALTTKVDFETARKQYTDLFNDAVRLRMRSDVPLGITLSSGVDSNSIAYTMQAINPVRHHSYTARFNDEEALTQDASIYQDRSSRIDESLVALAVAKELDLNAHVVNTDYSDFVERLTRVIYHLESGNSSPAVIPLMQLLHEARKTLVVVMDGQGADELLAGYISAVLWPALKDLIREGRIWEAWRSLSEYLRTYTLRSVVLLAVRQATNGIPFMTQLQQRLRGLDRIYGARLRNQPTIADHPHLPAKPGESALSRRLHEQHTGGLVNLLHYGDAISMANSLEARVPFLDHRLVELVWPMPSDFKVRLGLGKYIHREAMRGVVASSILDERTKHGFTTPIGRQFRKTGLGESDPLAVLLSDRSLARGLFDRQGLERVAREHLDGRKDHGPLLFRLLSVELWFRIFIDDKDRAVA